MTRELRRSNRWVLGLTLLLPAVGLADAKSFIDQAYKRTNAATTAEDYGAIIDLCDQANQAGLNQEQADYVNSLLAWAHNRRGEVFTQSATESLTAGRATEAKQLDGKALADFEAALKYDPGRWKPWHNRGVAQAIAGKFDLAIADFDHVLELKPDYANAWFNRGEIHYDLGKIDLAVKDYSEAIKLDAKDAGARTSRGHAYFRLNQYDAALADYSAAIELAPASADVWANRGDAYQSFGKWEQAARDLRQALQLDKQSPRVLQSAAWLMATCPDEAYRDAETGVQYSEAALQLLGQSDPRYLDTLAAAYANAGRFDEAVEKISAAIQQSPTDVTPRLKARLELYKQKKPYRQAAGEKTASTPKTFKAR